MSHKQENMSIKVEKEMIELADDVLKQRFSIL